MKRVVDNKRLKSIRQGSKMSQKEVADKVGIAVNYYSQIELGNRNPSWEVMEDISNVFGVSMGTLLAPRLRDE